MVLLIGGVKVDEVPHDSRGLYHMAPHLKEPGSLFAASLPKHLGPMGLLFVAQREFAACSPHDKNISIVATDGCTTCLTVIFRHPTSGAVALGHIEHCCVDGISVLLSRLQDLSAGYFEQGPVHMHIYGSFSDNRGYGEELLYAVLHYVHKEPYEIDLVAACVGVVNTVQRGDIPWPIVYGVGINIKTGEIFPSTVMDKGPDIPLRNARLITGAHSILEVYDYVSGLLRIGPFHYQPIRSADFMLQQPDEFLLQHLTSSPEVEAAYVASEIKAAIKHVQDHPFPEITIFPENRPRYYRKDENGHWVFVRLDPFRFDQLP